MKKAHIVVSTMLCLSGFPTVPAFAANSQNVVAAVTSFLQERTQGLPGSVSITVKAPDERQPSRSRPACKSNPFCRKASRPGRA